MESLLATADGALYQRLAIWLVNAREEDIASYWNGYREKEKRGPDIINLVFLNWTRLNPKGAINATAGSEDERFPWWAWACHDPRGSLAAATAIGRERVNNVVSGIGEFHPAWLREHFKEIPKGSAGIAVAAAAKWDDLQAPLESLKFMKENGRSAPPGTLRALARQDPWAAVDWVKQNPGEPNVLGGQFQDPMQVVIETMADAHPEALERLAEQTPSGEAKLRMESALFGNLAKTDPEAALEQVKSTTVPRIAAERYATLGQSFVTSDPEQAFELAKALFTACPDALYTVAMAQTPGITANSGAAIPGVHDFTASLMSKDPARLLEMTGGLPEDASGRSSFATLSFQWANRDLLAYTNWVNQQPAGILRDKGANVIMHGLEQKGNHAEALEWARSMTDGDLHLGNVLRDWKQKDADAASNWLESSDLPAGQKAELKASIQNRQ
ncbi:MAG: hypothetical protein V4819_05820 [Verrucomicrobiota bacterium]